MTDAISALRKHAIGLSLVRAQPELDPLALLEKAAKGVEVEGHKYLLRSPDGKGGWKYSYKPPADHKKQVGAFDPSVLKQAIEQAATEGHSAPFLLPHNGKVYLATAGGSWHSKEIKVFGHLLEGDGATSDNVDFDMPRSLGNYPAYVRTRHLPGGYSEARIDQHKPATPLFTALLPAARKKKNLEPVWHEGRWKHVDPYQVPKYERETAEFKYEKSLAKGEERPGHKYLTRKPDGKGGWDYEYPAEGSAEHAASKKEGELPPPEIDKLLSDIEKGPKTFGEKGTVSVIRETHPKTFRPTAKVTIKFHSIYANKGEKDALWGAVKEMRKKILTERHSVYKASPITTENWGSTIGVMGIYCTFDVVPRGYIKDSSYDKNADGVKPDTKPDAWRPAKVEKSAPVLFIKAAKADAVRGGEQAGHQYTERKPDGKGGWSYVYAKIKGALAARKAKRKTKRKIEHFWNKQTVSRLRASPSTVRRVALKTTSLAYKSADAIDALLPLIKASKGDEATSHKYLKREPNGHGGWRYDYADAHAKRKAPLAQRAVVAASREHERASAERVASQYAHTPGSTRHAEAKAHAKVTRERLDAALERAGMSEGAFSGMRAGLAESQKWGMLALKSGDALDNLDELSKAAKGDEVAGHKYLTRKPDGRGGWHYVYSHVVAGDTPHEHAREAASHSQQLSEARKDLDVASKARRESWENSHPYVFSRKAAPGLNEAMESAFEKVAKHRDAMRAAEKVAGIKPEKLRTVDVHLAIRDKDGKEIRDPEVTSMPAIGDYGITRGQYGIYHVTHIPSGYSINAGGALTSKAEAEHFVREMLHVAPKDVEFGGASLLAESYAHGVAKQLAAAEKKKSLDPLDELEAFAKGKMQHPFSEKQRRWAFAAEAEGKLPEGKALEWSHRAKGRKARARAKAKKGLKKSCSGCDPVVPCASCATDTTRKSKALRVSHEAAMSAAKRLGVEWEHARWTATDLQAGMQVELEHTKDLEKAADIALDHLCERPDYYKKLRSVEAGAKESQTTFCVRRRAMKKAFVPGQERAGHKYMRRKPDGKGGWQYFYTNVPPRTARSAQGQAVKRKSLSRSATPQKPNEKAARVGIPGDAVLPPPGVPKLPNLTHEERAIETRFADAFERDPNGTAQAFGEIAKKNNYVFETDGAKALLADWKRDDLPPDKPGEPMNLERAKARSLYNTALHQTANAIAKRAFITRLDEIAKMAPGDRKILVTSGGCAAGKGVGLAARPDLPKSVAATWDAAGEQNATENEWLISECAKRGIKPTFMFVHSDPKRAWPGAVARAVGAGRMVDARVFADSYAEGAKNFSKFHEAHKDHADFVFAEVTFPGGKPNVALGDSMPDSARAINADSIYRDSMSYIEDQHRAGKIASHIYQGATAGKRIWGDT